MYQIQRAYPDHTPTVRLNRHHWKTKYPFSQMDVGDSFWVPAVDASPASVRAAASNYGTRWKVKFRCKADAEGITIKRIR